MSHVALRKVCKSYGALQVVHDIDLEIEQGEFIVLVGPSGCGKSTLLRMVAGLEDITAGEIHIAGRRVNDLEPKDRDVAMVFQNYALYPHMTVFDNMAYGLRIRRLSDQEIHSRVAAVAGILELGSLLQRKPRELSGGQRQRVAMGRAIVREPEVFLFDEPLSNLDAKLRVQMRLEIQKLHRRLGRTSLYVTHDQVEAMTLAQRMIVLNEGRAEQIGAPMEVYDRPATRFVAGFIGSPAMNFVADPANPDQILGLRPEHLHPCAAAEARYLLEVEALEELGADVLVHGRWQGQSLTVRLPHGQHPAIGERLPVAIPDQNIHRFDAASGRRRPSQA